MVSLKHFINVKIHSLAMLFCELIAFETEEERVAETALVIIREC